MATPATPLARSVTERSLAPVLPTKLHPPRPRDALVARPRLSGHIEQGLRRALTLISAPAGSGKSTLLTQWLAHTDAPVGWLALDEADNQPQRFVRYLVAALHRACPALDDNVEPLLHGSTSVEPEQLLAATVVLPLADNDRTLVLVLDDYHLIRNPAIHQAMAWLLEHRPPGLHLILATRHDPPLPLARLRVRDELNEIRAADLRFDRNEAGRFFREVMPLALSETDIDTIETRTEGWVAALQLSALSLRGHVDARELLNALHGDHHLIADYLVEEVLDRQTPERRRFLLRTAVLERLCGSLCMALTGCETAQAALEALDTDNLFLIPLDDQRRWYRYHHLFAELLRRRLGRELPGEIPGLHRRASAWFRDNGLIHEALDHAGQCGDHAWLMDLLEAAGIELLMRGETEAIRDRLRGLPDTIYRQRPQLVVLEGWCSGVAGDFARTRRVVELGQRGLNESNALSDMDKRVLGGHFSALNSFVASCTGDPDRGLALAEQALAELPEEETLVRSTMALSAGNSHMLAGRLAAADPALKLAVDAGQASGNLYVATVAIWSQGQLAWIRGDLDRAEHCAERIAAMLEAAHCAHLPLSGMATATRARIAHERHRPEAAAQWIEQARSQADLLRDTGLQVLVRLLDSDIRLSVGDPLGARALLIEADALAESRNWPDPWGELPATRARQALAEGDTAHCRALLHGAQPDPRPPGVSHHLHNRTALLLALTEQRGAEWLAPLDILIATAEGEGRYGQAQELRALYAAALVQAGQPDAATEQLRRTLTRARPRHWRRPLIAVNRWLIPLAERLNPDEREFIGLDAESPSIEALIEPLSSRELDVLELLARGLSNQAIAERLFVSLGTIKTHVHNLLGKLQVGNRTEAVHRARSLGLLRDA